VCAVDVPSQRERRPSEVAKLRPDGERASRAAQLIKAEANLLRLPLFALRTKGLKTLDGLECRGRITRGGQDQQFTFRVTRNTATSYPGPLARAAHLAFLSIITESGLPCPNPLTWTWRDLCRRMGITYGGQMVRHLKEALTATAGLLLQSQCAVYDKAGGKLLSTQQEALHLYDRVAFVGSVLPDGTIADGNSLWLSQWYRENLNALFTAPLDYTLWQTLDQRSPIASRLYEFLLLNFYGGRPVLRINYETLAQFLPIKPERYRSSARKQLASAVELLTASGILADIEWADSKTGVALLHLFRGPRLPASNRRNLTPAVGPDDELVGSVTVRELHVPKRPEAALVAEFYRQWSGDAQTRPSQKELALAREFIHLHGEEKAKRLLSPAVKKLKQQWPEAKTFGAIAKYLPEASQQYERLEHVAEVRREENLREQTEEQQSRDSRQTRRQILDQWRPVWESLSDAQQERIAAEVTHKWPHISRLPAMFERYCIVELARTRGEAVAA